MGSESRRYGCLGYLLGFINPWSVLEAVGESPRLSCYALALLTQAVAGAFASIFGVKIVLRVTGGSESQRRIVESVMQMTTSPLMLSLSSILGAVIFSVLLAILILVLAWALKSERRSFTLALTLSGLVLMPNALSSAVSGIRGIIYGPRVIEIVVDLETGQSTGGMGPSFGVLEAVVNLWIAYLLFESFSLSLGMTRGRTLVATVVAIVLLNLPTILALIL